MLAKNSLPEHRIIECLHNDYGIQVGKISLLTLGADANASVYKVEAQDNSAYFVKLKHNHQHDISTAIMELLQNAGVNQIVAPLKTRANQASKQIDDFALIVYPFIEGEDGFSRALGDEQWLTLGKALRQVHQCIVPASIKRRLRSESYSPKWREIVRSLYRRIEAGLIGDDDVAHKLVAFMKKHALEIHRLVDRAEQLAQVEQPGIPELVLCHSDIHGGNVLLQGMKLIYLVDWDDPIMAPKERDLMFIGGGVANVWNQPRETALFYQGYGAADINKTLLAYYRHERIVEDIALYGQDLLLKSSGGDYRLRSYQFFIAMFEPMGVVDVAFQSDQIL